MRNLENNPYLNLDKLLVDYLINSMLYMKPNNTLSEPKLFIIKVTCILTIPLKDNDETDPFSFDYYR